MNKVEEIIQKFLLLKTKLDKSDISFLCHHSFRSLTSGIKGLYKDSLSPNKANQINNNNEKELKKEINPNNEKEIKDETNNNNEKEIKNESNNNNEKEIKKETNNDKSNMKSNNKDYFKNLLISLESTNKKTKNENNKKNKNIKNSETKNNEGKKSISKLKKDEFDKSPTILNDNENQINTYNEEESIPNSNNLISLNENEEEKSNNTNNLQKMENSNTKRRKIEKKISINIIDKDDKNLNIKEKIIENFYEFSNRLSYLVKIFPKMNSIESFYIEQKEKIKTSELNYNTIYIGTIKKIVHLSFNILSKIFNFLSKETENSCHMSLNGIFDILDLNIQITKKIKKFIKNNCDNCDLSFFKNIKIVGNYCYSVLFIKKNNYENMVKIQNRNDSEQKNKFFNNYINYLKSVNKLKHIFKDNNLFSKHFMLQPTMISLVELYEMNRKIINYQLNANFFYN